MNRKSFFKSLCLGLGGFSLFKLKSEAKQKDNIPYLVDRPLNGGEGTRVKIFQTNNNQLKSARFVLEFECQSFFITSPDNAHSHENYHFHPKLGYYVFNYPLSLQEYNKRGKSLENIVRECEIKVYKFNN